MMAFYLKASQLLIMAPRQSIIAANWKMYKTAKEARAFARSLGEILPHWEGAEIVVAPSFTSLSAFKEEMPSYVKLGAQNMHSHQEGAFTGEVSSVMLKDIGVQAVILGHSERRTLFHETDAFINQKILEALAFEMQPIFCIGETLAERKAGETKKVLERQMLIGLKGVDAKALNQVVIAYEPVWAIGTGVAASPEEAGEAHSFCREILQREWGSDIATNVRIIYGGSVKISNAYNLLAAQDIDGALIGGASLDVEEFVEIIKLTKQVVE